MTNRTRTFVIAGAGLAGARAAATLREEGFDGRVVLVGAEAERPYERPPLSKEYLRGEAGRDRVHVHDERFYADRDIDLVLGRQAVRLDPAARRLALDDGEQLAYDRLLLATGARPNPAPAAGADLDGVCLLRTVADADALRERLARGGPVVVVGAGWIGAEVAASARQLGNEVALVGLAQVPLGRVLGPEAGAVFRDLHAEHGVRLVLGTAVEAFEGDGRVERVRTRDGTVLECATAVVGIGARPRVGLAAGAGLALADGVLTDAHLRTSAPAVFAAGDLASARHPFYERPVRVEHWANALHQGPAAARAMLGRDEPYDRLPYFFSDQYDLGMEYTGLHRAADRVVFRGDPASREFIAFWLAGDRVTAAMNVNVWDVVEPIERLIRSRAAIDERRLIDPDVALAALAGAAA
jgi:3-phenylpropionate/trans-cinnamate dioxygenase ferredoxin reductase subunit